MVFFGMNKAQTRNNYFYRPDGSRYFFPHRKPSYILKWPGVWYGIGLYGLVLVGRVLWNNNIAHEVFFEDEHAHGGHGGHSGGHDAHGGGADATHLAAAAHTGGGGGGADDAAAGGGHGHADGVVAAAHAEGAHAMEGAHAPPEDTRP